MYYGLHTHQFCMLLMVIVLVDKTYIIILVYILFVIYATNLVGNSRRVNEYILLKSVLLINYCMLFKKLDLWFICYWWIINLLKSVFLFSTTINQCIVKHGIDKIVYTSSAQKCWSSAIYFELVFYVLTVKN